MGIQNFEYKKVFKENYEYILTEIMLYFENKEIISEIYPKKKKNLIRNEK